MEKDIADKNVKQFNLTLEDKSSVAFFLLVLVLWFLVHGEPDVMDALVEVARNWILK